MRRSFKAGRVSICVFSTIILAVIISVASPGHNAFGATVTVPAAPSAAATPAAATPAAAATPTAATSTGLSNIDAPAALDTGTGAVLDTGLSSATVAGAISTMSVDTSSTTFTTLAANYTIQVTGTDNFQNAEQVVSLTNAERAKAGVPALTMDKDLTLAAMQRAAEIAVFFSHTRPSGMPWYTVNLKAYGENIAGGTGSFSTAQGVMNGWMNSPGHRANLLTSSYRTIGVGCFTQNGITWWVQLFGKAGPSTYPSIASKTTTYSVEVAPNNCNFTSAVITAPASFVASNTASVSVAVTNPRWSIVRFSPNAKSVSWGSSNTSILRVDASGSLTGVKPGTARVTAAIGSAFATSGNIEVQPGLFPPTITKQPTSGTYYAKQKLSALSVTATTAGGTLSYQWYSNTANSTTGAKPISQATKATYTPTVTSVGTTFYFCRVTNTVTSPALGSKAVNSSIVRVSIAPDLNNTLVSIVPDTKTGLRIDVPGQSKVAGVQVGLWTSNNGPNQRYRLVRDASGLYRIQDVNSGLYLTVKGGAATSGAAIVLAKSSTSKAQRFKISQEATGKYTFVSALSASFVIGVNGNSAKAGASLVLQKRSAATTSQVFRISQIKPVIASGTIVTITNVQTGLLVDIAGVSLANYAQALTWPATKGANQLFRLTYETSTGYYKITPMHSGRPLTVYASQTFRNGAGLFQFTSLTGLNQQWDIRKSADGTYIIYQPSSGFALSAAGGNKTPGTPVIIWPPNGARDQSWILKKQ